MIYKIPQEPTDSNDTEGAITSMTKSLGREGVATQVRRQLTGKKFGTFTSLVYFKQYIRINYLRILRLLAILQSLGV